VNRATSLIGVASDAFVTKVCRLLAAALIPAAG
jgi:hypothetical protein